MSSNNKAFLALGLIALLACISCTPRFYIKTPEGFAEVRSRNYDYKATSPDGSIITLRRFPNDPKADQKFWDSAILNDKKSEGYTLLNISEIKGSKLNGSMMEFELQNVSYFLAVFVEEKTISAVECVAEKYQLDKYKTSFISAIESYADHNDVR
ncbi:MAG: hypothetical protein HY606_09255 [Planctomycetes bacterium]|nr:hypothetical protein [Planctomycetota bacterium]